LVSDTVRAAKAAYTIARQIMTGFFAGPVAEGGGGGLVLWGQYP